MWSYLTDSLAALLYESHSQEDPLSEEDQEEDQADEQDAQAEGEEDPGVPQLQQLLQEVRGPVHLQMNVQT